jgi:lysophospholipid acyltransferase (LPLAT)-like uncharacterized protein
MGLAKRLLRSEGARNLMARLSARYIRLVDRTTRWTVVRPPETEALEASGQACVICFWHGRLMMMGSAWQRPPDGFSMLISEHRDGVLISRVIARLGFATVAGSSKRGGTTALRAIARLLAEGVSVGFTPDGPRGPRMRAKPGPVKAAQLAGVPILPVALGVRRRRIFQSWDRLCLALPFSQGAIVWGQPITVPRNAGKDELERLRLLLEDRLNQVSAEADRRCGQVPIEPAESPDRARA